MCLLVTYRIRGRKQNWNLIYCIIIVLSFLSHQHHLNLFNRTKRNWRHLLRWGWLYEGFKSSRYNLSLYFVIVNLYLVDFICFGTFSPIINPSLYNWSPLMLIIIRYHFCLLGLCLRGGLWTFQKPAFQWHNIRCGIQANRNLLAFSCTKVSML